MNKYGPLVLALAAAGMLTGESLTKAYSEDVFVPELALLGGGVCGAGAPSARPPALLQLAQAAKTEVGPAAAAAAASLPAPIDADPPLMAGLGKLGYRVTSASAPAQRFFDQGLRLAWGFNHDEARRAFRKAQRLDPDCALCYWGEAWVLGPNINAPMEPAAIAPAVAAAARAAALAGTIADEIARDVPLLLPIKAAPYFAHARFGSLSQVLALPDPGGSLPYLQAARHYARGVALVQQGRDATGAAAELAALEAIAGKTDFKAMQDANIPGREVLAIAAHVLRARIAQARGDLAAAIPELESAVVLQDTLPYMEPPYWYYPVRQTLGALLVLKGEHRRARDVFRDSLAKTPNNGWALYGLAQTYARQGMKREAQAVERHLARAWFGERRALDLARL